jgi:hypothetical protein
MLRKIALGITLCLPVSASAQSVSELSITSFDPSNAVAPISSVEGPGIKIGEGTVLHPAFGIETGFVSNVFYEENANAAGILRLMAQIGTSSLGAERLNPNAPGTTEDDSENAGGVVNKGSFAYLANVRLAYDQLLSGNEVIADTGGLGAGAHLRGIVNPNGPLTFAIDDQFSRTIRAANFETTNNVNRDVNTLRLILLYHPSGRTLSGYLYYQNMVDIFEDQTNLYPNRMDHRFGLHPTWQLLPKTQLYGDFSMGITTGITTEPASERKVDSYPLMLKLGTSTLLTVKTAFHLAAGYTNGFYSSGPSYSKPYVETGMSYSYSPLGKVQLGYLYTHVDSVNANFYRDHAIRGSIVQYVAPFAFAIQPQVHFREYNGLTVMGSSPQRDDLIFQVVGGIHYNFRNWIAATANYKFSTVQTDFTYLDEMGRTVELNYARHELLLGMRVAL